MENNCVTIELNWVTFKEIRAVNGFYPNMSKMTDVLVLHPDVFVMLTIYAEELNFYQAADNKLKSGATLLGKQVTLCPFVPAKQNGQYVVWTGKQG